MSELTDTYEVVLPREYANKLAARADAAGVVDDLEYLESKIIEWLDDEERLRHCEK